MSRTARTDAARSPTRRPHPRPTIGEQFRVLIAQPATLCNLDCRYCYLPGRDRQTLMPVKVAQQLAASITEQDASWPVEVVWHGGEPLTTPPAHLRRLLEPFDDLRRAGRVVHAVQTNATLIDRRWIDLIREYDVQVGVSIDGPPPLNHNRVDRAGRDSFARAMAGIRALRAAGIAFSAICVVGIDSIGRADELLDFFAALGCTVVGFNIEEQEGLNVLRQQASAEQADAFWLRLWQLGGRYPDVRIRDLDRLRRYLGHVRAGRPIPPAVYDPIPTVAATGQTVVLSPELLGITAPRYRDFVIGNVLTATLPRLLAGLHRTGYVAEFETGLNRCATTCEFWDFCRGAQAGNRYFEHGRFDTAETNYCRTTYQAIVRSAVTHLQSGRELEK